MKIQISHRQTAIHRFFAIILALIMIAGVSEGKALKLTFNCRQDNDLYQVMAQCGYKCDRFDTAIEAISKAQSGSGVLILADEYPGKTTTIDKKALDLAQSKDLQLYIEYPGALGAGVQLLPQRSLGPPKQTTWERTVVASDEFGEKLPRLRILMTHDCHFVPMTADAPLLVVARVAGFDKAVYGLPAETYPILFEQGNLLIATTRLSDFVTGRYEPSKDWQTVWDFILDRLDPEDQPTITWIPDVRPAFTRDEKLPRDFERHALKSASEWYHDSRLLVSSSREKEIHDLLRSGAEVVAMPDSESGDGSCGILEGYASQIAHDGSQTQRLPIRSDCNAESAMALALDWSVNGNTRSRKVAENLLDYVYFTSSMHRKERGDPRHPAFGLIAWGDIAPAWYVANYSDDDARVMLSAVIAAACLGSHKWDESVMKGLLANLRTTGTLGFRGDRIDMPQIEANGWKAYHDAPRINYSPHHESYLWACNLWAYHSTGYKPFIEGTKTAIHMTMEAFPEGWRWNDSIERARMLLCLAWLVRVEDTPEHRKWLDTIANAIIERQQPSGAIQERFPGNRTGFQIPTSNAEYGTGEMPLIQQNGDPVSDQLYTTGFALLGLHEAYAATGDPKLKQAEDKLAEYLCRIQISSKKYPCLNGAWFRAFDYNRWDYWAASGDIGWGAWSVETGWCNAWITAVLGLRLKGTSAWDLTSGSRIIQQFHAIQDQMAENDGSPWDG